MSINNKPDPMAEDEIKKMLDNTILDWNRPSQLTDISANANYRKLIPAISVYTTNKIILELEECISIDSVETDGNVKARIAELRKTL